MIKRVFLFLLTNILVMATISIVMSVFGLHGYITQYGIDYTSLMVFCLLWGMGGAFISLLLSRWMAKRAMGVQILDPNSVTGAEQKLVQMVHRLARQAGMTVMPQVGVYAAEDYNAFATGATRNRSLVAVTENMLHDFPESELEAVLGHEITHIVNGDMVTMTLVQGVVNAFAMFLSRVVAYAVAQALREGSSSKGVSRLTYFVCVIVFDIIFTILGSLVTAAFSRWREFRADKGGAQLSNRDNMIAALRRLDAAAQQRKEEVKLSRRERRARRNQKRQREALGVLQISRPGKRKNSLLRYFASHPPVEKRIERLQTY